jgi:phage tail tape-measure protein
MGRVCRAVDEKLWMEEEAVDGGAAFAFVVGSVMRASLITAGSLAGGAAGDWLQERWRVWQGKHADAATGVHHQSRAPNQNTQLPR